MHSMPRLSLRVKGLRSLYLSSLCFSFSMRPYGHRQLCRPSLSTHPRHAVCFRFSSALAPIHQSTCVHPSVHCPQLLLQHSRHGACCRQAAETCEVSTDAMSCFPRSTPSYVALASCCLWMRVVRRDRRGTRGGGPTEDVRCHSEAMADTRGDASHAPEARDDSVQQACQEDSQPEFLRMKKYWYQRFSLFSRFTDGETRHPPPPPPPPSPPVGRAPVPPWPL